MAETEPKTVDVWPQLAPGETTSEVGKADVGADHITRISDVTRPQLLIFRPDDKRNHPAVMICPGGGYSIMADDLEGTEVAHWLNTLGVVAAVLHYRVPDKRDGAFQDAERGLSLLRARAHEFGIDPHRIGVLGFSAGGHLSARLACSYAERAYKPIDKIDHASDRPDFAVLVYPAYLINKETGKPAPEVQPRADTPPVFITQTEDDPFFQVPDYAKALEEAGVKHKAVTYAKAGHGYGLRLPEDQPAHQWSQEAGDWILAQAGKKK